MVSGQLLSPPRNADLVSSKFEVLGFLLNFEEFLLPRHDAL